MQRRALNKTMCQNHCVTVTLQCTVVVVYLGQQTNATPHNTLEGANVTVRYLVSVVHRNAPVTVTGARMRAATR